jgi:hypothetical protein
VYFQLEAKCFSQQEQLDSLQEQLETEREQAEAKRAGLEKELALRVDQVTTMYENVQREKDSLVGKVAAVEAEAKSLREQLASSQESCAAAVGESERLQSVVKKQKTELAKLQATSQQQESKLSEQSKEVARLKEEVSSVNMRVRWAQNKLKAETDAHKETKAQLTATTKRLNQAREEGEQIRSDLKTMITQYQESEEMRSNSLDVKLRETEKELKAHEQEIADQQELHTLTVKELELAKAAHSIAVTECQQLKTKMSEQSVHLAEVRSELDELRSEVKVLKEAKSKLTSALSNLEQINQSMAGVKQKLVTLKEMYTQLQRSYQHLEKDLARRKDREEELLSLTEKLSSANAELQAARSSWETKEVSLTEEVTAQRASLSQALEARRKAEGELAELREDSSSQIAHLVESMEQKSKAVEQLTMSLEDEREQIKALKRKHTSNTKDLQRQIAHCKRRMEQLESQVPPDREPPATLPITEGSRASSHSSIDALPPSTLLTHHHPHRASSPPEDGELSVQHSERALSDGGGSGGRIMFQGVLDQEKRVLVEKICSLKRDMARYEERVEFFESHSHQLTEDIQRKSKIIQDFIMREQTGALAPPSSDEHKVRHSRRHGIMASVFSGARPHTSDVNLDLSVEMNRKMQSVLEDTLLKNITLKESIDTLGQEIQRLSSQLQAYETASR